MTLESLLTFIGIVLAALTIARPVQRRSLRLFVPVRAFVAAILLSFLLIVWRDAPFGLKPPFGWPLDTVLFGLTLGAFVVPVGAALWSWFAWNRAKLTKENLPHVEAVLVAALREQEFDEVERILTKNQEILERLPTNAASVLFYPAMVKALVDSRSLIHLEMLANLNFLKSLENPFGAVDVVVRELLRSEVSPLRSAIVHVYGGIEHLTYSEQERGLMGKTFLNPAWYVASSAHYPLVVSAVHALQSGKYDSAYNSVDRNYETDQGISSRAHCSVYLAIKTEVLAIEAGVEKNAVEEDFYVSDLWQIFCAVLEQSTFQKAVWESSQSNSEFPTPYAYLLYEISADFDHLSATALEKAISKPELPQVAPPGRLPSDLARMWSACVSYVAHSEGHVSPAFRKNIIQQYLLFVLALNTEPHEILRYGQNIDAAVVCQWRDLYLGALTSRIVSARAVERDAIRHAFESLDMGKRYVYEGSDWLEDALFGNHSSS